MEKFKPLAKRAWDELAQCSGVELLALKQIQENALAGNCMEWDITLDGLYGMGFHPPLSESARELIEQMNNILIGNCFFGIDWIGE